MVHIAYRVPIAKQIKKKREGKGRGGGGVSICPYSRASVRRSLYG